MAAAAAAGAPSALTKHGAASRGCRQNVASAALRVLQPARCGCWTDGGARRRTAAECSTLHHHLRHSKNVCRKAAAELHPRPEEEGAMQACKSGGGDTRISGDGGERALQRRRKEEARARRDAVKALRRAKIETPSLVKRKRVTPRGGYADRPTFLWRGQAPHTRDAGGMWSRHGNTLLEHWTQRTTLPRGSVRQW